MDPLTNVRHRKTMSHMETIARLTATTVVAIAILIGGATAASANAAGRACAINDCYAHTYIPPVYGW